MSNEFSGALMEFVFRLCCTGPIDVESFDKAIVEALKHQPLLQANATIGPTHSTSYWRPATNLTPVIKWLEGDPNVGRAATDDFQPIKLENEIGFRFYGWQVQNDGQPRTEMRFVFQHACCDGKGAISFIEHVLCQYKLLKEGKCETMPRFDGDRIQVRDKHAMRSYSIIDRIWRTFIVRPKRAANMLLTKPLALDPPLEANTEVAAVVPCQCSTTLSKEVTEKLGVHAKAVDATTNLVLARELFHVLGEFRESNVPKSDGASNGKLLRMLIPFSLRNETHQFMPAANCVSMAYFETKQDLLAQDDAGSPTLIADLVKQLTFIRKWQLQYAWIESIKTYARIWPVIKLLKRSKKKGDGRQVATTVLSNFGRVFSGGILASDQGKIKIDSLEIDTVHVVLPCTTKLSINFSVNFYAKRLTLDVSYLPSRVTRQTAQQLLESWRNRVLEALQQHS